MSDDSGGWRFPTNPGGPWSPGLWRQLAIRDKLREFARRDWMNFVAARETGDKDAETGPEALRKCKVGPR